MRKLRVVTSEEVLEDIGCSYKNHEKIGKHYVFNDKQTERVLEVLGQSYIFSYDNIPATPLNRFLFLVKQVTNLVMFLTYRPIKWLICGDFDIPVTTKFGRFLYFRN